MHAAQHAVGARLQRRMHVLGDPRRRRHQPQQVVGKIHRLDGAEPQPLDFGFGEQQPDQVGQPHAAARLPAPAAQVDAAEHDFAIAPRQAADLLDHLLRRSAAAAAAHERNDAERAAIVAAVLDLQIGAGAVAGRVFHRRGKKIVLREDIADVDVAVVRVAGSGDKVGDLRLVRIADHPFDARHGGQFFGRALRVAARHQDARRRDSRDARGGWSAAHRHPLTT